MAGRISDAPALFPNQPHCFHADPGQAIVYGVHSHILAEGWFQGIEPQQAIDFLFSLAP